MKRIIPLFLAFLLALAASGCVVAGEELLRPPKAAPYEKLEEVLGDLLAEGYRYSAPVAGEHRQAVLLQDIDGDGVEEAVVFLKHTDDKPLKIMVYTLVGDAYAQTASIQSAGEGVQSVAFCDFDRDGVLEMLVGWRLGAVRALSVLELSAGFAVEVLSTSYTQYTLMDITGDKTPRLLLVQHDAAAQTGRVEMYAYREGVMEMDSSAPLSAGAESILRVRPGLLTDKKQGLFVASQYDKTGVVTDLFVYRDEALLNVTLSSPDGVSAELVRYTDQPGIDINGDGFMDLPRPEQLPPYEGLEPSSDPSYEIFWYAYDSRGARTETAHTYHSLTGNWYLELPEAWRGRLTVGRLSTPSQKVTIFACYTGPGEPPVDLLTLYSESSRPEEGPWPEDRVVLLESGDLFIYAELAAGLPEELADMALTAAGLASRFHRIQKDWNISN